MKILIDARALGQKPSGIGMYIYNIVSELQKDRDFQIELITDLCKSSEMLELQKNGIPVHSFGKDVSKSFQLFLYYRFIQKCIFECRPQIFWEANHLVPIRIRNPYGRLVATEHDMYAITAPEHYGKKYSLYFYYGVKKTIRYFDVLIFDSEETKKETERLFPMVKLKKSYIGYFVIPQMPEKQISDNRSFLYVGNLETRKGTDILLKAYRIYKEQGGTYGLRICGNIRNNEIRELLDRLIGDYEKDVHYLGYLEQDDKANEYASCSCFVFPSRAEGFGVPIIEAMNYQKPILASNLSIFHEVVGDRIHYVDLSGQEDLQIHNFAAALKGQEKTEEKLPKDYYQTVLSRYGTYHLGLEYRRILKECAI